jgi:hypothetical protein
MRTLKINAKCSDLCFAEYEVDGITKAKTDSYAPNVEGLCGGDYVDLEIDLDTGQIIGWVVPTHEQIMNEMKGEEEEEEYRVPISKKKQSEINRFTEDFLKDF